MPAAPSPAHVVIVGGGFAGLYCAKELARAPVRVTLVDRRNHHLFQPLLYQVATATLSPSHIAAPIRRILRSQRNCSVLLGEAVGLDLQARKLRLKDGEIGYDYLVLATGATHSYFGHPEWASDAPGLKSVEDAVEIRRRFLLAFEHAERETNAERRRAELTFVVVGAGPTGTELAGAMAEIARKVIPSDFRSVDTTTARVILVEAADRVLPGFPPELSQRAARDLTELGVEVRVAARVTAIDSRGVNIGAERIDASNVLWAAGVRASEMGRALGVPTDPAGRVEVGPDFSVPGFSRVFVAGDLAKLRDAAGVDVPGLCPSAVQAGRYVARAIDAEVRATRDGREAPARPAFRYRDKGILATIGRHRAVAAIGKSRFSGWFAWYFWALLHVFLLIGFRNRLLVMMEWVWEYFFYDKGARLITGGPSGPRAGT